MNFKSYDYSNIKKKYLKFLKKKEAEGRPLLDKIVNKLVSLIFRGKYLEGLGFKLEYKLKNFFTILSSKE